MTGNKKNPDEGDRFEDQLERLEAIVAQLEDDSVGLEQSLDYFEQGMALAKSCRARLEAVEHKVSRLLEDGTTEDLEVETS